MKTRRVYVASDDPKVDILGLICSYVPLDQVLGECRKKYPEIEFIGDQVNITTT